MLYYGIPSYHRPDDQLTLTYLEAAGVPADHILMAVQCTEDETAYRRRLAGRCRLIYRQGGNVAANRNTLLIYAQQHGIGELMMLDDDITCIKVLAREGTRKTAKVTALAGNLDSTLTTLFATARRAGAKIWGGYPVDNPFFQRRRVTANTFVAGGVMGICDTSLRFDEQFSIKEDYELCLRIIAGGGRVLRYDYISSTARMHTAGGCLDAWKAGKSAEFSRRLIMCYPDLVAAGREGELKMLKR